MSKTVEERDRANVAERFKWNLTDLYPSDAAWRNAMDSIRAEFKKLGAFQGKLESSANVLANALDLIWQVDKEVSRLWSYASLRSDEDTRVSGTQGMQQEVQRLSADFRAQTAYVEPEIIRMGPQTVERFLSGEQRLAIYAFHLRDTVRRAAHTLSEAEEKILADLGPLASSPSHIFNILFNADFPYPLIRLADGNETKVDQAGYVALRASKTREDRKNAMTAFFSALGKFSGTFGATMNANIQRALFHARTRRYASDLESSLDGPNIPVSVYTRLIEGVHRQLPSCHRYLQLRRRMLGISDELHYYDLYAPLVASVNLKYSPEEAQREVLDALAPLGSDYVTVVERAFWERWIDFFPTSGKRSGAYSDGAAYDVHPYILLNYLGQYQDVSTLAHELGHTMHSYCSNKGQPYALAYYHTFVAEVASTFNEALLMDYVLGRVKDPAIRLSLLGNYLESIRTTVFRQTQLAEFELEIHRMAERGEPITGEAAAKRYLEIARKFYGHDHGVCTVDDEIAHEWSYIPHFYSSFYVFQYATSFTAASALAEKVSGGDPEATKRFLKFLSSGTSKYPIELLKDAGVDMTTDEPLELTIRKMNRVMDEMEQLLS
jgi:oligoendopeptidase F